MNSTEKPLLVTSINPGSNLEYQIKCFERWKAIGFEARTVNVEEEAGKLRAAGIARDDIKTIDAQDSGLSLFSKPVPRIKPLLESLEQEAAHEFYVISNSDIFPALRSASVTHFWNKCSDALALTREECISLDAHAFPDHNPYRGGLDAFFMSRNAVARLNDKLSRIDAAERMAFGVPGWDYLVGACMLTSEVGGHIADSRLLLHVSHRQAYADIDEFSNYVGALSRMGFASSREVAEVAEEFAQRIDDECAEHGHESRMARIIYFRPPELAGSYVGPLRTWEDVINRLVTIAPQMEGQYRIGLLGSLVDRLSTSDDGLDSILHALLTSQSKLFQFTQALFATALALHCKSALMALTVSESYPKNNRHNAALKMIMEKHSDADPAMRLEIATLFAVELVDYRILNRRLFDYLALSCGNDGERGLLTEIKDIVLGKADAS